MIGGLTWRAARHTAIWHAWRPSTPTVRRPGSKTAQLDLENNKTNEYYTAVLSKNQPTPCICYHSGGCLSFANHFSLQYDGILSEFHGALWSSRVSTLFLLLPTRFACFNFLEYSKVVMVRAASLCTSSVRLHHDYSSSIHP